MPDLKVHLHAGPDDPVSGLESSPEKLRTGVTDKLGDLLDRPPAVELTSSCTHALEAAAVLLDIGRGDEVIVPAFAFPSVANAFLLRGATIRFADVDPATGNIDPETINRLVGPNTRAVVCVHYGGVGCDMDMLTDHAFSSHWALVEDAAHGLFGRYHGKALGRFGVLGALSFHRTKNISSVDGGALIINDEKLVERARVTLDKGTNRAAFMAGKVESYEWSGPGSAWRLSDGLVGYLDAQLDRYERIQTRRHEVWTHYAAELASWAEHTGTTLPYVPIGVEQPAHLFWMLLPERLDRSYFVGHCADRGVEVARHFGSLPTSSYGRSIAHPDDRCPVAQRFGNQLVRLPLHHQLNDSEVERVIEAVTSIR